MTLGNARCPSSVRCRRLAQRPAAALAPLSARLGAEYYINASLHAPDAVILDLEDSVHRGEKDAARILVRNTCGRSISDRASAWCASTNCPWGSRIWLKLSAKVRSDFDSES